MEKAGNSENSATKWLVGRVGNPLEWNYIDKSILFLALQIAVYFAVVVYIHFALANPSLYPSYVNRAKIGLFLRINEFFVLVYVICFIFALLARKTSQKNHWFVYTGIFLISAHDAIFLCGIGHATNPLTFLVFFLFIFNGLLLFDTYFTISAVSAWVLVHGFHIVGEQVQLISYAWLLKEAPFTNGTIDTVWLVLASIVGILLMGVMGSIFSYVLTRWREREAQVAELSELLKKMFGRYLSTEVMTSLIKDPSLLELGGERREVTIMITDLRGFTALSERLKPEQVVQMLNAYFEVMVETVLRYKGTINEIIGDALLVIFGAPQDMPDQAERAIACSIEMQNAMAAVNKENRLNGLPDLEMGIGINMAEVIVGNIGSNKRSKYTVVGSGVNMASRIESYTVGGQILISESVLNATGGKLRIDSEQEVYPKGSLTPLKVYEVGGIADQYNLILEVKDTELVALQKQIVIRYSLFGGKHTGKDSQNGKIVQLSKKSAEIVLETPVDQLANLKMGLIEVEDELMSKNFYGKKIDQSKENHSIIRFTSIPPEINSYFHAYRHHAPGNQTE